MFLVYCWRTVLWELTNWKNAALAILRFFGSLSKLALAFVLQYIGDPITGIIRSIEFTLYFIRDIYSSIVAFAPVPELTRIIVFASTILAIAEATVPDSVNNQPYLLTLAGLIAFGAVNGIVLEPFFWLLLLGMFCYSRFIKRRDNVSAAMPSAAALTAVGEPWVRALTIASYLSLAIIQHSKSLEEAAGVEVSVKRELCPLPLLLAAFAIGIHLSAKWIRYRHLTWMIA